MHPVQDLVAIVGGLGPLASAAFVTTIYERTTGRREQDMPRVLLWSDPQFPDRTSALLEGRGDLLAEHLRDVVERCEAMGATRIVICCVTVHAVLPLLPPRLQTRIVSLVDVLLFAVVERQRPQLLLTTLGTRHTRMLEQHPLWKEASRWLLWPGETDRERLHQAIYDMKRGGGPADAAALVEALLRRHRVGSFVAACTELHLVTRYWSTHPPVAYIDPLAIIADQVAAPLACATPRQAGAR